MNIEGKKLPALRKEKPLKTNGLTDKEIYEKYYASKYSIGDLGKVIDEADKKPSTEPIPVPLADVAGEYRPMGTNIDTGIGHTTPDSYWNTIATYGENVKNLFPSVPLVPTSALLVGGALGSTAFRAYQNLNRPQPTNNADVETNTDMIRPELQRTSGSIGSRGTIIGDSIMQPLSRTNEGINQSLQTIIRGRPTGSVNRPTGERIINLRTQLDRLEELDRLGNDRGMYGV